VIKSADWVIDLGPEAGDAGGCVVADGPPETVAATPGSHTGEVLKPILAAGPHAKRLKFDPTAGEATNDGDVDLDDVGKDAQLAWEADGQRWHTESRITGKGKPARWEGAILPWLDSEIRKLGEFGPTNWNHRTVVETPATTKSHGWFLHAMTGQEWLVPLVF